MNLYVVVIGLIVFLTLATAGALTISSRAERRNTLMRVVQGSVTSSNTKTGKKVLTQDQRRAELAQKLKSGGAKEGGRKTRLPALIMQAGFSTPVRKYWMYSTVFMIAVSLLAKMFGFSPFVVVMAAITSLLGIPKLFLKICAKRRQKKFLEDFADALEAMVRLLKAGMPVTEAISMVSREYSGPIGEEMTRIFDEQKIGVPLPEAVLKGAERIPIPEMQMFATAVAIQAQTGSSLSEVLHNLAHVIRARFRLRRKVDALSSEAKASAMIIGALPLLVATGMYFINREYIEVLFVDPTGKFLLGAAIFWMFVGIMVMRQMINFKI